MAQAVVLVEGISDKVVLETFAGRQGMALDGKQLTIVPMSGAQAIGRFLPEYWQRGDVKIAGLCDLAEESLVRVALEQVRGRGGLTRQDMEALGFFVCVEDLEDELIRAAGADAVERLIQGQEELAALRTFQREPAWRGRPINDQLRRFLSNSNRKARYGRLLAESIELHRIPRPLQGVLAHARSGPPQRGRASEAR